MRVFQIEDNWSMENVRIGTRRDPQAGPGQVRLKMKASALNYRDLLVPVRGYGSRMKTLPLVSVHPETPDETLVPCNIAFFV
ncbi:MAG: hypothetical protein ACLQVJ_02055 [Syntrophobacteraceae bacterium]